MLQKKVSSIPRRLYSLLYDLREFRALYWSGVPEARIARHLHVDRSVVRRLINKAGLLPHSHLSANRYLAAERSEAERRAFTAAAHAARRRTALR
jgi:hypothetical protein